MIIIMIIYDDCKDDCSDVCNDDYDNVCNDNFNDDSL